MTPRDIVIKAGQGDGPVTQQQFEKVVPNFKQMYPDGFKRRKRKRKSCSPRYGPMCPVCIKAGRRVRTRWMPDSGRYKCGKCGVTMDATMVRDLEEFKKASE